MWMGYKRGLPRGFGDRRHCSKMWRQSFSDSPTADKNWQKKGDNLRQRQSIFTFDKATCIHFAFFESVACVTAAVAQGATATSLPGSVIPLWPRANKPLQVITKSINHSTVVTQLVSCFLLSCHRAKVGLARHCSFSFLAPNVKVHPRRPSFIGA